MITPRIFLTLSAIMCSFGYVNAAERPQKANLFRQTWQTLVQHEQKRTAEWAKGYIQHMQQIPRPCPSRNNAQQQQPRLNEEWMNVLISS